MIGEEHQKIIDLYHRCQKCPNIIKIVTNDHDAIRVDHPRYWDAASTIQHDGARIAKCSLCKEDAALIEILLEIRICPLLLPHMAHS